MQENTDLAGAGLSGAKMSADMENQSVGLMRAEFAGAELGHVLLRFANLTGADATEAISRLPGFRQRRGSTQPTASNMPGRAERLRRLLRLSGPECRFEPA